MCAEAPTVDTERMRQNWEEKPLLSLVHRVNTEIWYTAEALASVVGEFWNLKITAIGM